MQPFLDFVKDLLKFHKKKFAVAMAAFLFFCLALFPFGDLADLVTVQVSKLTQNQVYLQFDDMGISVLPSPGISLANVQIDTPNLPTLKTGSLSISPSLSALLSFKPGFSARAKNFLSGNVFFNYKAEEQSEQTSKHNFIVEIEKLELGELEKIVSLPLKMKGLAHVDANVVADFTLREQPDGDLEMRVDSLTIPPSTVPTAFGPMALPAMKLSQLLLKGRISNSEFIIEEGTIGGKKDPLSGRIKGKIGITFRRDRGQIKPFFEAYELKVELVTLKEGQDKFGLFLGFIDNRFKTQTNAGFTYQFKIAGSRFGAPPRFSELGNF
ncbi:MAG: type II secretion system protein GspN [Bdellovibrionales bacterium]|nr:type II secretion system protein GspN [Bdellovibrionales bacterium]